jgi:hypothetical protein
MSASPSYEQKASVTALIGGPAVPHAAAPASRGSPESQLLIGPAAALKRAETSDQEQKEKHRGGDRAWMLRGLIPVAVLAEAITAYVAMEALVASRTLAAGLSLLTALIAAGLACAFANRRLSGLPVPPGVRALEWIFVAILTVLRGDSLYIQGPYLLTATVGAAQTALVSMVILLGIEEIVVETRTLSMFTASLRVWWRGRKFAAAAVRLAEIQARAEAADK